MLVATKAPWGHLLLLLLALCQAAVVAPLPASAEEVLEEADAIQTLFPVNSSSSLFQAFQAAGGQDFVALLQGERGLLAVATA